MHVFTLANAGGQVRIIYQWGEEDHNKNFSQVSNIQPRVGMCQTSSATKRAAGSGGFDLFAL